MEEQFVSYVLALKLKELGFDEICFAGYTKGGGQIRMSQQVPYIGADYGWKKYNHQNKHIIKAPLWQQAFDWFREKYNYNIEILTHSTSDGFAYSYGILTVKYGTWIGSSNTWSEYKEARSECLQKLIEICQEQKEEVEQKK